MMAPNANRGQLWYHTIPPDSHSALAKAAEITKTWLWYHVVNNICYTPNLASFPISLFSYTYYNILFQGNFYDNIILNNGRGITPAIDMQSSRTFDLCRLFIFIFLFVDVYSANLVSGIIWGVYSGYRRSGLCKRDDGECSWVRVL